MAKRSKKKSKSHFKAMAGLGTGLALVAAGAAGSFFLYGTKEGAKKRKQVRGWVLKAKGEVLDKLEDVKEVNEEKYREIVESVASRYANLKKVDPKELELLIKELKGHWKNIKREIAGQEEKKSKRRRSSVRAKKGTRKRTSTRKRKK